MIKGIYMTVRIILPLKDLFPTKNQKKASASCTTFCLYVSLSKNSILYYYINVQRRNFSEAGAKVRLFSELTKLFRENFHVSCKNSSTLDTSQDPKQPTPY